jgi:hypothetical protein
MLQLGAISPLKMLDGNAELAFIQKIYTNLKSTCLQQMPVITQLEVRVPHKFALQVFRNSELAFNHYRQSVRVFSLDLIWYVVTE